MKFIKTGINLTKKYGLKFMYSKLKYRYLRLDSDYSIPYKKYTIHGNNRTAMHTTHTEVFVTKCYDFPVENVKTIIDLGANIGLSSIFFSDKYNKPKIVMVEPSEENITYLKKNIFLNNFDNCILLESAIWTEEKYLHFTPDVCTPSYVFNDSQRGKYLSTTMNDIIEKHNIFHIDILKVDIEGGEDPVLVKNNDWLDLVDNIFIEIHSMVRHGLGTKDTFKNVQAALYKKGFKIEQYKEGIFWFKKQ